MFALRAWDHVVQDSVDKVLNEADVGWLIVIAEDSIRPHHAAVRVPSHTAGDINQEHGFKVVRAVEDTLTHLLSIYTLGFLKDPNERRPYLGKLVEGCAACVVGYVRDLRRVVVGFDLPVALEHIARAVVLRDDAAVDHDLAGVSLVTASNDRIHVLETD